MRGYWGLSGRSARGAEAHCWADGSEAGTWAGLERGGSVGEVITVGQMLVLLVEMAWLCYMAGRPVFVPVDW